MKKVMIGYMQNKKHDHFDTPAYAVKPLLPYINKKWKIWEPTDTYGRSEIARVLRENGNEVISTNFDFLESKAPSFDCIVTNPPFSIKDKFIERCMELGKRWAMLLPITTLEGVHRGDIFRERGVEVLVLDRRVEFMSGSVWFNTSWFCHGILPGQLIFGRVCK